jgi:hypothetical protein
VVVMRSAMARMSRFSKTEPRRSPVPPTPIATKREPIECRCLSTCSPGGRVEIIDADKKILLQTGDKRVVIEYKDYYFWGSLTYRDKYVMDTANAVADKIVSQLAEQVRGK